MNSQKWPEYPHFLREKHLMEILGIGRSSAYKLLNAEGFPTARIGKLVGVTQDALQRWLDSQAS